MTKNKKKTNILGINIDNYSLEEIKNKFNEFLKSEKGHLITTPNAEIILKSQKDEEYFFTLNHASLSILDGFGPKIAGLFMGFNIKRITGVDLCLALLEFSQEKNIKVAIVNLKTGLSKTYEIEKYLKKNYNHLKFKIFESNAKLEDDMLISEINNFGAQVMIVNFGAPQQEKFIFQNLKKIPSLKIGIGIGGTFDFLLGKIKRAPLIFRKLGLESFWRLINIIKFSKHKRKERLKRITNALFIFPYKFIIWRFVLPWFYRPNVACFVYKKEQDEAQGALRIKILIVERQDEKNHWQIPQGGLDGLSTEEAGMKELGEELNNHDFKKIAVFKNIHKYKFDIESIRNRGGVYSRHTGYKGQKQDLLIAEFYGNDNNISVNHWDHVGWKWVDLENILDVMPEYRKEAMKKIIKKFKEI
jgi:N-acetylglucosaminyldiphosphoundecaprenol N-acetyl-beta-D-mannosaminyltransferase